MAMTRLRLPSHISFGLVGDRPIFLDRNRDCYLTLDGDTALAFRRITEPAGRPSEQDEARLLATGLVERGEHQGPIAPAGAPAVEAQFEPDGSARAGILDSIVVWRLLRRANSELRRRPLLQILAGRASLPSPRNAADPQRTAALARRFHSARGRAPVIPRCLPDSLALWDWLHARGAASSIIFGVKLDPFGAHCWVQQGSLALNEAVDRTGEYSPVHVFP
jgi:hypothetical protein